MKKTFAASKEDLSKIKLGSYLLNEGKISQQMLNAALEQQSVSMERLGTILVTNNFITQKDKIDALKVINIDQLAEESTLITRCSPQSLIDTQTMILIEDINEVYLSSMQPRDIVEARLRPFYPNQIFYWNPVDVERLDDYLAKVEKLLTGNVPKVDLLLRQGLQRNASDIHFMPRTKSYSAFMRIDGILRHAAEGPLEEYYRLVSMVKERSNLDSSERRVPLDGAFQVEHQGRDVDLRVATSPTIHGEKVVIRILDPSNAEVNIENVGITRLSEWKKGIHEPHGICLICGPTGSGKTTTLNATITSLNRFEKSINTIEDPVEYSIPFVTQVNTNPTVGLDFARGLKAFLRMDPDVIVVGEIRDIETANIAIKAAETGHLVLGTLHTGSIEGALERLRDIGVDLTQLKNLLRSVMVQRLVRKLCTDCKGNGCGSCDNTGYKGRMLISETKYFGDSEAVVEAHEGKISWPSLIDDVIEKYLAGETSRAEVVAMGVKAQQKLDSMDASNE